MVRPLSGFLNIDKPAGLTSHDVVARVRRLYRAATGAKKVGHAGTLDPMATGVLVVCLGDATRLSEYVMASRKTYRGVVRLGIETDTYDAEGEIVQTRPVDDLTQDDIEAALMPFRGYIQQVPPMYSAIKQGGKKLYDLARRGQTVERPPRPVTIHALKLADWSPPDATLEIVCSAGTYIRSLAHDLGQALAVGGHLVGLRRTASGTFTVDEAVSLDALLDDPDWPQKMIAPGQALSDWPSLTLTPEQITEIGYGRRIPAEKLASDAQHLCMAYTPDGDLVAVLRHVGNQWKPHKVFLNGT